MKDLRLAFFAFLFFQTLNSYGQTLSAKKLFERLTGSKVVSSDSRIVQMQSFIDAGAFEKAAAIATNDKNFYSVTVKNMALKMSTKEETSKIKLNDFAASFIGVTRDGRDARELLTGNFYYRGAQNLPGIRSSTTDLFLSNNHYEDLDNQRVDLKENLVRVDQQVIINSGQQQSFNPDPAGVLTSRSFIGAHAIEGTNRRLVEYTFREFLCTPLGDVADSGSSDARIGKDVDRFPSGDHNKYTTNCKGCHTVMDGFRGAFAKVDFKGSGILHSDVSSRGQTQSPFVIDADMNTGVVAKMNKNANVFPGGYRVINSSFENFANRSQNQEKIGWKSASVRGNGIKEFGQMVADSERFSQCMVRRVYEQVCQGSIDFKKNQTEIRTWAQDFENTGYDLKKLFENIAIKKQCLQ